MFTVEITKRKFFFIEYVFIFQILACLKGLKNNIYNTLQYNKKY